MRTGQAEASASAQDSAAHQRPPWSRRGLRCEGMLHRWEKPQRLTRRRAQRTYLLNHHHVAGAQSESRAPTFLVAESLIAEANANGGWSLAEDENSIAACVGGEASGGGQDLKDGGRRIVPVSIWPVAPPYPHPRLRLALPHPAPHPWPLDQTP